jgi:hypothetical protein
MKIKLFNLRCGFAAFYRPGAFGDGDPAWQTALIIPPDHPAVAMLDKTILAVATEKWKTKAKAEAILKTMEGDRKRMCFHKKPYTNDEGTPYDGFDGAFYLRARNPDVQPLIVDRRGQEVGKGQDGAPYSGCYVNVEIDVWPQDNNFGKAIRAKLLGVQFVKDGDAFTGGNARSAADAFGSLEDGAQEEAEELADDLV